MPSEAKNSLLALLAHEKTRTLMGRLAQGDDPRRAVAEMAGQSLAERVAAILGAASVPVKVGDSPRVVQTTTAKTQPVDVTDAEYVVIDVSPGVKRRSAKEK